MSIIKIINPFSHSYPTKQNLAIKKEFARLTALHKSITLTAVSLFTLLTLGLGTTPYLRKLVGRFRKVELEKAARLTRFGKVQGIANHTLPLSAPPSPQKMPQARPILSDFNQIEKDFWESHFQNENLRRFLEMAAINRGDDYQKIGATVVDHYLKIKTDFTITDAHKAMLINSVAVQLKANEHPKHPEPSAAPQTPPAQGKISSSYHLQNGRKLVSLQTGSDGSCALHALLGVPVAGIYKTDAAGRRKALCDWLEKQYQKYQLHERACIILQDYFDHFGNAPDTFCNAVRKKHQHYRREFDKLGGSPQDLVKKSDIKADFIYDPEVFRAYRAELMNVSRYMLQEELIMAAECFGCQLELHQPAWNNRAGKSLSSGDQRVVVSETFNSPANISIPGKKVHVWYNGINHYERAEIS
ncbi:MAG: hypothetical protein LLG04_06105 [Parachlamydia sp.]|nr:hypothetical protein [Parachlamydia sp.]